MKSTAMVSDCFEQLLTGCVCYQLMMGRKDGAVLKRLIDAEDDSTRLSCVTVDSRNRWVTSDTRRTHQHGWSDETTVEPTGL